MEQEILDTGIVVTTLLFGKARRHELAHFLRTRRAALTPASVGLPTARRRRVVGLRREEVAEAPGISVAWYTWMEQSRDLNLSTDTLDRLSSALQLNAQEKRHLFQLAGQSPPLSDELSPKEETTLPAIERLLQSIAPNPAYVLDVQWNIVAWNEGAVALFGDFGALPQRHRNMIRLMFLDHSYRGLFLDWVSAARCVLSHFRSDSAGCVEEFAWQQLVEELRLGSAEFAGWWQGHMVSAPFHWRKELMHPAHGVRSTALWTFNCHSRSATGSLLTFHWKIEEAAACGELSPPNHAESSCLRPVGPDRNA